MGRRIAAALYEHAMAVVLSGLTVATVLTAASPSLWPTVAAPCGIVASVIALVLAMAAERRAARPDWQAFEHAFWTYVGARDGTRTPRTDDPER